jgi:hypothetical protein
VGIRIDENMNNHIRNHVKDQVARLSSIKGANTVTVAAFLTELPEQGALSRGAVSALVTLKSIPSVSSCQQWLTVDIDNYYTPCRFFKR